MSLGRKLAGGLKDVKGAGKAKSGGTVEAHEGKCQARVQARELDKLAVVLDEVEVWTTLPELSAEESEAIVESQARRVESKIGYLVEGFKTIEFDRPEGVLQMRSAEPISEGEDREYFELILAGGRKATLRRYRGSEVDPGRITVPINLTTEVLERFVDDLSTILMDRRI